MRHWLIRLLALFLAAATAALAIEWRRSYATTAEFTCGWRPDTEEPQAKSTALTVLSRSGHLDVTLIRVPAPFAPMVLEGYLPQGQSGGFLLAERHLEPTGGPGPGTFKLERVHVPMPRVGMAASVDGWELRFPHWLAAVLAAGATALALRPAWRRYRRRRGGLCVRCGYDLRSSTGRCPECGERIDSAAAPGAAT